MAVKKKSWVSIEITKVRLDPQQAVLSCCDSVEKAQQVTGWQCWNSMVCPTSTGPDDPQEISS
jgi:hypothetical protein